MNPAPTEVTDLLIAWQSGDQEALDRLTPLVQAELHRLARRYMAGERSDHTLQPTALINEAWMRLIDWRNANWQNRAHFFAVSAKLMRHILVDHAQRQPYVRGAGGAKKLPMDNAMEVPLDKTSDLIALDDVLRSLTALDARKGKIVELRFFGGLNEEEIAEVLKVSTKTVQREWAKAKAWMYYELTKSPPS